jgi:hypothetical protein
MCGRDTTNCYGGRHSQAAFRPLRSPASELRRGQIAFRAVKFRNGLAAGPHPLRACPCARGAITCFGAPVANLIQVNVGTPRSAEMAAAENAQDVVFSGSIKNPHKATEMAQSR